MNTKLTARAMLGAAALIAAGIGQASAYEPGESWAQKPGATLGAAAEAPPPGLYMIDQAFTYQSTVVGPGSGNQAAVHANVGVTGFLFAPGWTFLGGTYTAVAVQPFIDLGTPGGAVAGIHNTFISPVQLTWKLGDFGVTADLGIYVPDGSISGANGTGNVGAPYWTFQPELRVGYYKDGWAFTVDSYVEINTKNSINGYTTGDILHEEFTFTKTFGKWTVGPVAYYVGQVTNDSNPLGAYGGGLNNKFNIWAVGGLLAYNFGPASLSVWAADEVSVTTSGGTPNFAGVGTITRGWTAFATLSYQVWSPSAPAPKVSSMVTK
ncbi:MAG: transporter [Xanthobacteraceae bacterium]|nr:transporter [Xanthobacteraceae bacterium]